MMMMMMMVVVMMMMMIMIMNPSEPFLTVRTSHCRWRACQWWRWSLIMLMPKLSSKLQSFKGSQCKYLVRFPPPQIFVISPSSCSCFKYHHRVCIGNTHNFSLSLSHFSSFNHFNSHRCDQCYLWYCLFVFLLPAFHVAILLRFDQSWSSSRMVDHLSSQPNLGLLSPILPSPGLQLLWPNPLVVNPCQFCPIPNICQF